MLFSDYEKDYPKCYRWVNKMYEDNFNGDLPDWVNKEKFEENRKYDLMDTLLDCNHENKILYLGDWYIPIEARNLSISSDHLWDRNHIEIPSYLLEEITGQTYEELDNAEKPQKSINSGFLKPVKMSDAICNFVNLDPNETHSIITVTKKICEYIRNNNLQNPNDNKIIIPDTNLKNLLNIPNDHTLNYFQLQKYLSPHYLK
jgi:chromatin remodeling complex protein RSC6